MTIVFQHSIRKSRIEHFWSQEYFFILDEILCFHKVSLFLDETLHVNKFEDADFKYDIRFLKIWSKIPN